MAPEATIDFDAPHVATKTVLLSFLAALGFFGGVMAFVKWSDPVARSPVARRSAVITDGSFKYSIGLAESAEE